MGNRRRLAAGYRFALFAGCLTLCGACAQPELPLTEFHKESIALDAPVRISLRHPSPLAAKRALETAELELVEYEASLKPEGPTSEIARIHDGRNQWTWVSPALAELLRRTRSIAQATDGAFDPTSGALYRLWNFESAFFAPPRPDEIQRARAEVGWWKLQIDPVEPRVRLSGDGTYLYLRRVGRAFLADRVLLRMRVLDIPAARVQIGNIGAAFGGTRKQPWRFSFTTQNQPVFSIKLLQGGVATVQPSTQRDQKGIPHTTLIHPRLGRGLSSETLVSVVASSATLASGGALALHATDQSPEHFLKQHSELQALVLRRGSLEFASTDFPLHWNPGTKPMP